MFGQLHKKLREIKCRTLLGRTARQRAQQLKSSDPTLSEPQATQIASREAVASLREQRVDATSLTEVMAWSKRFLARSTYLPQNIKNTSDSVLKDCDLVMTAIEIRNMLRITEEEATARGEAAYYKPEFLEVLYPFIENPSVATATQLLQIAPFLRSYFEKCSPGGEFFEMRRFL